MLVVSLEGTYVLETDGGRRSIERPCALARPAGGPVVAESGAVLGSATSAIRS